MFTSNGFSLFETLDVHKFQNTDPAQSEKFPVKSGSQLTRSEMKLHPESQFLIYLGENCFSEPQFCFPK